ncbi:hypothetical protein C7E12_18290, partial [Stenotrophomonas maltophilia]
KVGDSDLGGSLQFEVGRDRPRLTATLESKRLDFDDLAGFVGAPPKTWPGPGRSATHCSASPFRRPALTR